MESSFETRLKILENDYESRVRTLESELESRLRGLEMGYEGRMRGLEKNYESVLVELVGFQRGVAQQDGVLKSLIRCFLGEDGEFLFPSGSFFFVLWHSFLFFLLPIELVANDYLLSPSPFFFCVTNVGPLSCGSYLAV